ncbi:mevalonate kinase [Anopheles ziemanni]|uniref:mevalonate kinase n=1 Tax=Anopheles coustani TaxID=139045 RepID=UPI002659CDC7|nr:mevalonate kinase [Anopheles coustani]XP_058166882.1 mevalonate kinase [Anopheles ziemanni]
MALDFEVSAPGKVILHGEHSVIYGFPAVAGPIGLRTNLRCSPQSDPVVTFEFRSIPFTSSLTLGAFNEFLAEFDCSETLLPEQFLQQMRAPEGPFPFARFVRTQPSSAEGAKERFSLGVALYIVNRVLRAEGVQSIDTSGGFTLSIGSAMSIGAGLGSSASFGVCLGAGAYALAQMLQRKPVNFDDAVREKVSGWAFDSEVIMHGKPSGIDNTIATYGKLIRFRRGDPAHQTVALRHPVHILIVDTGVSRSTAKLVAINAERRALYPRTVGPILEAMGGLVEEAIGWYESDQEPATVYERLGTLVAINNNLLRSLGASHPALEQIFALAEQHGYASKLTGAGGGGCAFILLPANYREQESFRLLDQALRDAGFNTIETTIADGQGVSFQAK